MSDLCDWSHIAAKLQQYVKTCTEKLQQLYSEVMYSQELYAEIFKHLLLENTKNSCVTNNIQK